MGDILQIRLICATPDPEAARARWPQLCRLARELYDRNRVMDSGQGLFLPHWDENQPMPGVRELARTLQQAALIFHKSIYNLPEDALRELSHTADALGDALGNWRTAEARDALKTLLLKINHCFTSQTTKGLSFPPTTDLKNSPDIPFMPLLSRLPFPLQIATGEYSFP